MSNCPHYWTVTSECPRCLRAEVDLLRNALHCISLGAQNSMHSKEALGREAREAIRRANELNTPKSVDTA